MAEIRRFLESGKVPEGHALRVGIQPGLPGCSGGVNGYLLAFDLPSDQDEVVMLDDLRVLIDRKHALHVLGMEVDYVSEGEQQGFVFNNPRMKREETE
jgi:iron-sulfur cluster assembly protein